jgi:molybdopterin molybdotransferase
MVTVGEATTIISNHLFTPVTAVVSVETSVGKVLAEEIIADRDFPPFNRVSMDGIAIQYQEWQKGRRTFFIEGVQAAGEHQKKLSDPTHCMEVMTGAILPAQCDTVIRYEDVDIVRGEATVTVDTINSGQSIHPQAIDARKDQVLLKPGVVLAPSEVALMASVGKAQVTVYRYPKVAIISTGDELVAIDAQPNAYQIRRSNSYALQSALADLGAEADCFHLQDEQSAMEKSLMLIVKEFDVLILSGGVSKGKFDFVPGVLESIGIRKLFHQVSQRPGKPFWFGESSQRKIAFALPGNPVSTFMCFYRYVKPWMLASMRAPAPQFFAVLGKDYSFPPPLTCFLQVSVKNEQGRLVAYPEPGGGSGDFANLKNVTGFLELPLEKTHFKEGEVFPYISFRR